MSPIYHVNGSDLEIFKAKTNGVVDGFCPQTLTCSGGLVPNTDKAWSPSWTIANPPVGSYTLTLSGGSSTVQAPLEVLSPFSPTGPILKGVFVGDSITLASQAWVTNGGFVGRLKAYFGDRLTLLGTQSTSGNAHEGFSGQYWGWHREFGPLANGGDVDIDNYETNTISDTPDFYYFSLTINDIYVAIQADPKKTAAAQIAESLADDAEALIAGIQTDNPSASIIIATAFTAGDTSAEGDTATEYADYMADFNVDISSRFDNRTGSGVYVVQHHLATDPETDYPDAVHPSDAGHVRIAERGKGIITKLLADAA